MRSLYESLFDVDNNVDSVPEEFLVGDNYEIKDIYCRGSEHMFKKGLLKVKPPKGPHKVKKIDLFDDTTNKMVEVICNIILNLPAKCAEDSHMSCVELSPYLDPYLKTGMSNPYINTNSGRYFFNIYGRKWVICRSKDGTPRRDQPGITIFLNKKH